MTRKDYILIAEALKEALAHILPTDSRTRAECFRAGIGAAAQELADALARDNPRFDRERFLKACGVQS